MKSYKKNTAPSDRISWQLPGVKEFFNVLGAPVTGWGYEAESM